MKTFHTITSSLLLVLLVIAMGACSGSSEQETGSQETADTMQTTTPDSTVEKINLNTGTEEEFLAIPGVGEEMVHEFEEYHPYVSISQFRKEIGKYVDEETVAGYEQYLYVPIDRNESDAATLRQIPGLDDQEANTLMEGRPYGSNQEFLDALSGMVNENQLEKAKKYLAAE